MRSTPAAVTQEIQIRRRFKETQETQRHTTSSPPDGDARVEGLSEYESVMRQVKHDRGEWFADAVSKPLPDFVIAAYQFNERESGNTNEWHSPLFHFTWLLRGHPTMQACLNKPKDALGIIETFLRDWTRHCKSKGQTPPFGFQNGDGWLEWFGIEKADARAEFVEVWEKSRYMPGADPLGQAADANRRLQLLVNEGVAAKRPLADADDTDGRWRDYQAFIGLAGHLQVAVGDQNIMLPCDKVGDVMGVSKMTVSRYRRWAIEDGYLVLMKKHQFRSKGRGDATEFRFNTDRFKCLQAKAQVGTTDVFQRRG